MTGKASIRMSCVGHTSQRLIHDEKADECMPLSREFQHEDLWDFATQIMMLSGQISSMCFAVHVSVPLSKASHRSLVLQRRCVYSLPQLM